MKKESIGFVPYDADFIRSFANDLFTRSVGRAEFVFLERPNVHLARYSIYRLRQWYDTVGQDKFDGSQYGQCFGLAHYILRKHAENHRMQLQQVSKYTMVKYMEIQDGLVEKPDFNPDNFRTSMLEEIRFAQPAFFRLLDDIWGSESLTLEQVAGFADVVLPIRMETAMQC